MRIDSHIHFFPELLTETPPFYGWNVEAFCINSSKESDWESIIQVIRRAETMKNFPKVQPFFGIHPWFLHDLESGWENRLFELLESIPNAGIGEVGLDSLRGGEAGIPVFETQLKIAVRLKRPVTLHVCRMWDAMFRVLRSHELNGIPLIFHGFSGSPEQVKQILHFGWNSYFSLNVQLSEVKRNRLLPAIPSERLLEETDAQSIGDFLLHSLILPPNSSNLARNRCVAGE